MEKKIFDMLDVKKTKENLLRYINPYPKAKKKTMQKKISVCHYADCMNRFQHAYGTIQYYCCPEHRLLARGSKKGLRIAARIARRKEAVG